MKRLGLILLGAVALFILAACDTTNEKNAVANEKSSEDASSGVRKESPDKNTSPVKEEYQKNKLEDVEGVWVQEMEEENYVGAMFVVIKDGIFHSGTMNSDFFFEGYVLNQEIEDNTMHLTSYVPAFYVDQDAQLESSSEYYSPLWDIPEQIVETDLTFTKNGDDLVLETEDSETLYPINQSHELYSVLNQSTIEIKEKFKPYYNRYKEEKSKLKNYQSHEEAVEVFEREVAQYFKNSEDGEVRDYIATVYFRPSGRPFYQFSYGFDPSRHERLFIYYVDNGEWEYASGGIDLTKTDDNGINF
ncbi:hypothetical protein [Desemzia sp. FAM 23990]|uniref:hypothetical protein n=1 Tax=Desemzia sp. FAM 23990 TaxID=3259520 RepID=UPI0038883AE8